MLETPKGQGTSIVTIPEYDTKVEMGNQQVTLLELGWLAGIIDGEGYIGFQVYKTRCLHHSISTELSISNTDEPIILRAQRIIQAIGVNPYVKFSTYKAKNKPTHKNLWTLVIHRLSPVAKVLEAVSPYMTGAKKERAILVLEYCKSRFAHFVPGSHNNIMTDREAEIIELCIAKQKRGSSETIRKEQLENSVLARQKSESRRNNTTGRYSSFQTVMI